MTMAAVNGNDIANTLPVVLSDNRGNEDDSTISEVTWPEIDGHLRDLAQIHDPGYRKLSMEPEHSPIPSVVSCIQLEGTKAGTDDRDVTAEYIDEIVELKLQLANHQAEIDELKASLNRCMLDNEALLAEKSALVDEIAQHRQSGPDGSARSGIDDSSYSAPSLRSSILSMGRRKGDQQSNSQLLLQNSHLQVENNVLRKSLQANILGDRRRRRDEQHQSGHKASFATNKTADETLSASSLMPEHWPTLNDRNLDDVGSDEMSSHASTGAWVGGHDDERQNRINDDDVMWPACGRHTDDENESHDSNSMNSSTEEQDCNDTNLFSGVDFDMSVDFGESVDLKMSNDFNCPQDFHRSQEVGRDRTLSTQGSISKDHRDLVDNDDDDDDGGGHPHRKVQAPPSSSRRQHSSNDMKDVCPVTGHHSNILTDYCIFSTVLGKGDFGCVRECMHRKTKQFYAVKSIEKLKTGRLDQLKREVYLLSKINHRGVMKMIDIYEDVEFVHIVTDKYVGGELFDRIIDYTTDKGCFDEVAAGLIVKSLLEAVAYLHRNGIVHRDIKPENILFVTEDEEDLRVKLIDFGLSRRYKKGDAYMSNPVGTAYYMSPELLKGKYDQACDVWSTGIVAYILLCGYPPFNGNTDFDVFDAIVQASFQFPSQAWGHVSPEAKDFIKCLLRKDPRERFTAEEALKHPWIRTLDRYYEQQLEA